MHECTYTHSQPSLSSRCQTEANLHRFQSLADTSTSVRVLTNQTKLSLPNLSNSIQFDTSRRGAQNIAPAEYCNCKNEGSQTLTDTSTSVRVLTTQSKLPLPNLSNSIQFVTSRRGAQNIAPAEYCNCKNEGFQSLADTSTSVRVLTNQSKLLLPNLSNSIQFVISRRDAHNIAPAEYCNCKNEGSHTLADTSTSVRVLTTQSKLSLPNLSNSNSLLLLDASHRTLLLLNIIIVKMKDHKPSPTQARVYVHS
ncbi:hypothetical protein J6590_107234 [Homalodisca vitripennis]|nr:hypothetical protein J6590_107234 [Homalodisca vitripennis]